VEGVKRRETCPGAVCTLFHPCDWKKNLNKRKRIERSEQREGKVTRMIKKEMTSNLQIQKKKKKN
jgi:hypothetical protein